MEARFARVGGWIGLLCAVSVYACAADSAGGSGSNLPKLGVLPGAGLGGSAAANQNTTFGAVTGASGASTLPPGTAGVRATGTAGATGLSGASGRSSMTTPTPSTGAAGAKSTAGMGAPAAGVAGMTAPPVVGPNQMLPPTTAYDQPGPFDPTTTTDMMGPNGQYTLIRPANVDQNGFKFVPATWGNGITTTPSIYPVLLSTIASHGFVIIASDDTAVTVQEMIDGLNWLKMQNDMPGDLQGKLDTTRSVCIGYSLGGQGAVSCGAMVPDSVANVGMHPAGGFTAGMKGPLLLFSGQNDTVCVPSTFVQPIFDSSPVPTFFGMLNDADHLEPVLTGGRELAPMVAWLRLWVFGDQGAKPFFYGPNCTLCQSPWVMPQSKMLQ